MKTLLDVLKSILLFFKHSYLDILFPFMFIAFLGILIGFIGHKKTFFLGAMPLVTMFIGFTIYSIVNELICQYYDSSDSVAVSGNFKLYEDINGGIIKQDDKEILKSVQNIALINNIIYLEAITNSDEVQKAFADRNYNDNIKSKYEMFKIDLNHKPNLLTKINSETETVKNLIYYNQYFETKVAEKIGNFPLYNLLFALLVTLFIGYKISCYILKWK